MNYGSYDCDDGNLVDGDGCSSDCEEELGWSCSGGTTTTADTCVETDYITPSLSDCQAYADTFFSTCSENAGATAPTFAAMSSTSETCLDNYGHCMGTVAGDDSCSWSRKLCVTCYREDGYTMMRVQTNTFPDHCYSSLYYTPVENQIDFSVAFSAQSNILTLPELSIAT
jgi:cysteine-rich repeat protein